MTEPWVLPIKRALASSGQLYKGLSLHLSIVHSVNNVSHGSVGHGSNQINSLCVFSVRDIPLYIFSANVPRVFAYYIKLFIAFMFTGDSLSLNIVNSENFN